MAIADLVMPKLGESIMEATILKWHKQVGDNVKQDETVLDIATDKVDSEVPSTYEGVITEILFRVNDVVPIGAVIARINTGSSESTTTAFANTTFNQPEEVTDSSSQPLQEINVQDSPETITKQMEEPIPSLIISEDIHAEVPTVPYAPGPVIALEKTVINRFYSPLVLNIANSEEIPLSELERIPGTGNDGRVSKKDILQYVADRKSGKIISNIPPEPIISIPDLTTGVLPIIENTPGESADKIVYSGKLADPSSVVVTGTIEIVEMDRMRKLIAKHMVNSVQTSPHVTSFAEADVTNMFIWRKKVKEDFEKREGTRLTFTPMFLECIVNVIKRFPLINCSLEGDNIILKKDINIGMATALSTGNLIVPVIKGADQLNIVGLSVAVNNMADAARNNKLKPEDTQGGTFTFTNVGTFGSLMGTPIINQPQVAILAAGAIKKRAVVIETNHGDTIGIRHMMYLSLSYDHRIVDGSIGAGFLSDVAKEMEKWDPNKEWFHYL